jgi:tetratricopeptide (TPR) repeat protein
MRVTLVMPLRRSVTDAVPPRGGCPALVVYSLAAGLVVCAMAQAGAAQAPDAAATALARGEAAERAGRYADALDAWAAAVADDPRGDAALARGRLLARLGRADEARPALEPLLDLPGEDRDPDAVLRAARAAHTLGDARTANSLYQEVNEVRPTDVRLNTWWGELFLEKHNTPEAVRAFEAALTAAPAHAPALVGLARARLERDPPAAAALAQRVLAEDPGVVAARLVLAEAALAGGDTPVARAEIERALAVNPAHLDALALRAGLERVADETAAFERTAETALAINPRFGELYREAGAQLAARYRFDEAVPLLRRAVVLDPDHPRAHADLGLSLLRTGEEAEARAALDRAFELDPFDAVTYNLLALLDTLAGFDGHAAGDLVIRLHPDETRVMRDLVTGLAFEAMESMRRRYDFEPRGPVLVEMFPRHDDFAVRTAGLPGMVGAVGACFGRVVTLDSPRARPPGSFNWAATLWHELAHVFTLQMSGNRVPRWLSEGVSVYEERGARPHWGRESDADFVQALAAGRLIPLARLDAAFASPAEIGLAYHQAGLLVEHLVEAYGLPALRQLVRAYGMGTDDETAFAGALGVPRAAVQEGFERFLDARLGPVVASLAVPPAVAAEMDAGGDATRLSELAAAHPGVWALQLALGRSRQAAGDLDGAAEAYRRAWALAPPLSDAGSPGHLLAAVYERAGRPEDAASVLAQLLERTPTGTDVARDLARLAEVTGDASHRRDAYRRLAEVDPLTGDHHAALGRLALQESAAAAAEPHLRRALQAGVSDEVAVRADLADSLWQLGRGAEAKREVIAALEQAPRFERAQDLLLLIVGVPPDGREVRP